jgi:hypothetical protein
LFWVLNEILQGNDFGGWIGNTPPAFDAQQTQGIDTNTEPAFITLVSRISLVLRR